MGLKSTRGRSNPFRKSWRGSPITSGPSRKEKENRVWEAKARARRVGAAKAGVAKAGAPKAGVAKAKGRASGALRSAILTRRFGLVVCDLMPRARRRIQH